VKIFGRIGILLVVGAVIAAAVVAWSLRPGRYDGWVETTGTVIDHRVRWSTDSETRRTTELRAPVVAFTDESGKRFVVTSTVSSSDWPVIGSNITVRYPAGRPADARIGDEGLFVPLFFGIWAGVLGFVGTVFLIVARPFTAATSAPRRPDRLAAGEDTTEPGGLVDEPREPGAADDPWPRYTRPDDQ
jgi:hypothetical protein